MMNTFRLKRLLHRRAVVTAVALTLLFIALFSEFFSMSIWPTNLRQFFLIQSSLVVSSYKPEEIATNDGYARLQKFPFVDWQGAARLWPRLERGVRGGGDVTLVIPFGWLAAILGMWATYLHGRAIGARRANPDSCRRCGYPLAPAAAAAAAAPAAAGGPAAPPKPAPRTCPECGTRNPPSRRTLPPAENAS